MNENNSSGERKTFDPINRSVKPAQKDRSMGAWEYLSRAGLAESALRLGTHAFLMALILLLAWGLRAFYQLVEQEKTPAIARSLTNLQEPATARQNPTDTPLDILPVQLPSLQAELASLAGVPRMAMLHTDVPSRPRTELTKYIVQAGDTLFGIAEKFGLKAETILWSNQLVLADNPHNLRPGQELVILPIDGAYYRWSAGDGLNGVAKFFGVQPDEIINYPPNHIDLAALGDLANPNIDAGTWLIIPGGRREFVTWSAPVIPRDNPGVAKILGPGACDAVVNGSIGNGIFIWPANNHFLSGYDYNPEANHPGIDIDGNEGDPVYAADSGVIVYAGWNDWGYGNVVVINHGNGWQTLYAHLSTYYVNCGQSVLQGAIIGTIGATGNATGSHLHFEMMYNGVRMNPHEYIK
ncbi:MAG: peptidoglycan DD-metalloendopeptidase family protein [Anaerolineales bacterium]|nr:peptidoglycan DD-metalloendopeptidase family protein [Anaerolineales bacterium]